MANIDKRNFFTLFSSVRRARARVCVYTPRDIISPRGFKSRSSPRVRIIYNYRTEEEIVTVLSNDSINREYFSLSLPSRERDRRILSRPTREKRMEGGEKKRSRKREKERERLIQDKKGSEVEEGTKGSREKVQAKNGRRKEGREGERGRQRKRVVSQSAGEQRGSCLQGLQFVARGVDAGAAATRTDRTSNPRNAPQRGLDVS